MALSFSCKCGERLSVDEQSRGRKVFCPKCRTAVEVPLDAPSDAPAPKAAAPGTPKDEFDGEIFEPRHVDRGTSRHGEECWKLTCPCGKRIHSPIKSEIASGRCPKCGRRLRLPGFRPSHKQVQAAPEKAAAPAPALELALAAAPNAPSAPTTPMPGPAVKDPSPAKLEAAALPAPAVRGSRIVPKEQASPHDTIVLDADEAAGLRLEDKPTTPEMPGFTGPATAAAPEHPKSDDEIGTIVLEPDEAPSPARKEMSVGRNSALTTADKLRAHHVTDTASGIVSAWPLAGKLPRILAGFVDLTFATVASGLLVGLAALKILPESFLNPLVAIAAFVAAGLVNDCILQVSGGGLGKRLVVLALRSRRGNEVPWTTCMLRGLVKWLILPGWLMAFFDPAERSLHDIICGTLVLKGRHR